MRLGLETVDALVLAVAGTVLVVHVDSALARALSISPIEANPLRPSFDAHVPLARVLVGLAVAAIAWWGSRESRRDRVLACAVPFAAPALGLALAVLRGREWEPSRVAAISLLALLGLPLVERRRARSPWLATWLGAAALAFAFVARDPAVDIAWSLFPHGAILWIGVAALGTTASRRLWLAGLRLASIANATFWTCAFWSLCASSLWVSRCSVGIWCVAWRCSGGTGFPYVSPDELALSRLVLVAARSLVLPLGAWYGLHRLLARASRPRDFERAPATGSRSIPRRTVGSSRGRPVRAHIGNPGGAECRSET